MKFDETQKLVRVAGHHVYRSAVTVTVTVLDFYLLRFMAARAALSSPSGHLRSFAPVCAPSSVPATSVVFSYIAATAPYTIAFYCDSHGGVSVAI